MEEETKEKKRKQDDEEMCFNYKLQLRAIQAELTCDYPSSFRLPRAAPP